MKPAGSLVLTLHGHMPWVMQHGQWPHGEHWLYEAALEVWLPLLEAIEAVHKRGARAPLTIGLTPVLLEQLRLPRFQDGFSAFLDERLAMAARDGRPDADPSIRGLARHYWEPWLLRHKARFEAIDRDIVGAYARLAQAGHIELLSSLATHGYAALIKHDRCIRAQLDIGLATSERHLGFRPRGIWLPECSFRPAGEWKQPVLGGSRSRTGVDRILEESGVTHFFVDAHLVAGARSEGLWDGARFAKVDWQAADRDEKRGWRSVLEPHRVNSLGGPGRVTAFARHPDVSEQVWSADAGYPGDARYLEFHKRQGQDGLRYWRVTDRKADLGEKDWYDPEATPHAVFSQAQHFASLARRRLLDWRKATGRDGCVTAPFDAELFGHWWHEGVDFLRDLLLTLHHDPDVRVETAQQRLERVPPDKVAWLPEGSWGEGGDHRVWINDQTAWTWEAQYRIEDRFLGLRYRVVDEPGASAAARQLLREVARELLLLQASDWQFVIHSGGAVDYGFRRICGHLERLEALFAMVEDALAGRPSRPEHILRRQEANLSDPCFADLDLAAWRPR